MGRATRSRRRLGLGNGCGRRGTVGALTLLLALFAAGLAAAQAGGPDLAVSITAKPRNPAPHRRVEISITVTNQGHASAAGIVVTLSTRDGLGSPRLINATPDTVQTSCAVGGPPGGPPQCVFKPVPPSCQSSENRLTCRYSYYQLQPAGQQGDSLSIIASAVSGTRRRETASASAASNSPDANPANNSARFTFHVHGSKKGHRR